MRVFSLIALMAAVIFESDNLTLRRFTTHDAPFIFQLLNTPNWKKYIGDRNICTADDAVNYIITGPLASYNKYDYGAWLAALKATGEPIGMCGLFKRDYLDLPDLGFAFLPGYEGRGFGFESSMAAIDFAVRHYQLNGLYATTTEMNLRSQRLLQRCSFLKKGMIKPAGVAGDLILYYRDLETP